MSSSSPLYMIALQLSGRRALVVGGGPVARDKVDKLLACGARVTLVSPEAVKAVRELADEGSIVWRKRPYESGDLDGAFLVIAATDDTVLNARIHEEAEARSMLVNVVDVPDLCNFQVPAVTRQGPIAIAISTAGASPALAKRMKREIAETFGEPYARLAEMLNDVRAWAKEALPTYDDRRDFFEGIVNGSPDPIELLRDGGEDEVRALIAAAQRRAESAFAR